MKGVVTLTRKTDCHLKTEEQFIFLKNIFKPVRNGTKKQAIKFQWPISGPYLVINLFSFQSN